ncbi:pupal cuticle protein PCP52-like [Trichoplusia ni]|uniref:Pupal cuticle protein PCP52-like n=1 Tax=Trichoplusia ni TaxID=7111 RepID=A0A7E5WPU0_TRINI|nr:pupal cuticle protein PCP52-like [Trichoplusia ni]
MRVLIVSTLFAVAAAAPSGLFAPAVVPVLKTILVPEAIPTISPGDIQAAAIDAQVKAIDDQVKAQDAAQAAADQARDLADQANENNNEKAITEASAVTEQNLDAYWSAEDKKWQAVDALKTAEAQIDGAVASNAPLFAKAAVKGALPYISAVGPVTPIVAPIPPVIYSPYVAPYSSASSQTIVNQEAQTETKAENSEAAVKTAEPAKPAEEEKPVENAESAESPKAESPALKAVENLSAKPALVAQPLISAPLGLYRYDVAVPAVAHVVGQPIFKYAPAVHPGVLTPTFVKTVW